MRKQILKIQKFWLPKWCYRNIKALMHQITKIPPHISGSIAVIVVAVVMAVTLPPNIKVEAQQSGSGGPSASTETNAQNNTSNSGVDVSPATSASIVTPEPTTTITPTVTPEPTATITPAITPEPTATLTPAITPGPNAGSITAEEILPSVNTANATESAAQIQESLRNANIDTFLNAVENQLGKPYIHGNEGPRSFDCSGLVYYCLKQAGVSKARNTAAGYSQETDWEKIASMHDLQKGDLMFFRANGKKVGHVGIYIGNGEMIDASSSNRKVVKRSCLTSFWVKNFITARRPAFN